MKLVIFTILIAVINTSLYSQNVKYKYDNANRLIQAIYPNQTAITYTYDKDGNRINQTTGTVKNVVITNPADSSNIAKGELLIYPNPNKGIFKGKLYVDEAQEVTIQILTLLGQVMAIYTPTIPKGFQEFSLTINPTPPTGTYIITVKGKTVSKTAKMLITN